MPRTLATFHRGPPLGAGTPRPVSRRREPVDGCLGFEVPVEQLRHQRRLPGLCPHRRRQAGPLGVQPVPERRRGPRQQRARPQLRLPPAAHPLGDQRPLVLRDRPADLQQQLVVRIGAHRPAQELHLAAAAGQLVDQQHLVDVVAGQPVRRGHQHQVKLGQRRVIAEPVQPRPADTGAAITVITVDMLVIQLPAALRGRRPQPVKLLLDALRLGLAGGRDPRIRRHSHQRPPQRSASGRAGRPARPDAPAAGRPDPTGARRPGAGCTDGRRSRSGSSGSPTRATSLWRRDPRNRSGRCHQVRLNRTRRTQQNLPFVIRPSKKITSSASMSTNTRPGAQTSDHGRDRHARPSRADLYRPGRLCGLTCGAGCPRVTVRDRPSPGLMARQWARRAWWRGRFALAGRYSRCWNP